MVLEIGQFLLDTTQTFLGRLVFFFLQRLPLDFELHDPPLDFVELGGDTVDLRTEACRRLIYQVNSFVRKKSIRNVTVGQRRCGDDGRVLDPDSVMELVSLLESPKDGNRVLLGWLLYQNALEPPLEGGILLDVLAILVEGGRADTVELAAGQHRLEKISGVHRSAFCSAGAHDIVELIDEENDTALRFLDRFQHRLEAFFELSSVFCAGDEGAHVERHDLLVLQAFRNIAANHPLSQSFRNGGFADTGLTYQNGIVFGSSRQDLDDASNFVVPSDHRIELALRGELSQVSAVLL